MNRKQRQYQLVYKLWNTACKGLAARDRWCRRRKRHPFNDAIHNKFYADCIRYYDLLIYLGAEKYPKPELSEKS